MKFLNIKVNSKEIDVNVHPAKSIVKFSQEKKVFSTVVAAIKNALARI